jgi:hypothetical protein
MLERQRKTKSPGETGGDLSYLPLKQGLLKTQQQLPVCHLANLYPNPTQKRTTFCRFNAFAVSLTGEVVTD